MLSLAKEVLAAARDAGERIQTIRQEPVAAEYKDDRSPVTRADREADALLKARLTALVPDAAWLSEETADQASRLSERRLWVVDPLDGTKEFLENVPQYTVAVALVEDGRPVLGVVVNPASGEAFWGARGCGAYSAGGAGDGGRGGRSGRGGSEERLGVRDGNLILASRSEIKRGEFEPFGAGGGDGWVVEPIGSIEYKLALVAAGLGAVTFSRGPKHEWDVCAGALLVEEAGGRATDLFGEPLVFNQPFPKTKGILAGAEGAYSRVLARIREIGASDRMAEFD
jgi:myo-inositol-1(or 4)-monophosphatase